MENCPYITPDMKIADLLHFYPQLEDSLIQLSPEFKKLKNPILRKTIAKIATIEQAARVSGISIELIINTLRSEVAQNQVDIIENKKNVQNNQPDWFDESKIVKIFDSRDMIKEGKHPLGDFMRDIAKFNKGDIYELITPFFPAPLVDKAAEQGFECYSVNVQTGEFLNYFRKL